MQILLAFPSKAPIPPFLGFVNPLVDEYVEGDEDEDGAELCGDEGVDAVENCVVPANRESAS